ncbi:hypothetical protein M3Y94_00287800 [Aphelenchoides besseyi]|nr:hypothetical protein M3Y94_00287800 [Aphelenchoides besseyi]KAI6235930.1 Differentially expressed in FDCP 8-like protein [Aphelenchoides besseyi]
MADEPDELNLLAQNDEELLESDYQNFVNAQINHLVDEERRQKSDFSHVDELEVAIRFCRNYLADRTNDDTKRAEVMAKLVELKLELLSIEESKEKGEVVEQFKKSRGHSFLVQSTQGRNPWCEVCMSTIWRLTQNWRRCSVCGFRVHDKCVENVNRVCAGLKTQHPKFKLNLNIRIEKSLYSQNYKCGECQTAIGFGSDLEPRLCDYNGRYYCPNCHWNDLLILPSRMVRNWDAVKRPVCRASKQLICLIQNKPIINLKKSNPMLFKYVSSLETMQRLRTTIILMKCYFVSCKFARELRILQHLSSRAHFVESSDLYSLNDLIEIATGNIVNELEAIVAIFAQHITQDCLLCRGQGFICQLCRDETIIFPFSVDVSTCIACCAVYHRVCYERVSKRCPRCQRRKSRQLLMREEEPVDSDGKTEEAKLK